MIKFRGTGPDGGILLGFGLSEENVRRLQDGRPILVDLKELELEAGQVLIFYGETEQAMAAELSEFVTDETKVYGEASDG